MADSSVTTDTGQYQAFQGRRSVAPCSLSGWNSCEWQRCRTTARIFVPNYASLNCRMGLRYQSTTAGLQQCRCSLSERSLSHRSLATVTKHSWQIESTVPSRFTRWENFRWLVIGIGLSALQIA